MKYFYFALLNCSLLFSNIDIFSPTELNISTTYLSHNKKPILHIGGLKNNSGINPIAGMQIQPTKNLLLSGTFSNIKYKNDLSIYYNFLIGYYPKWKLSNKTSNIFQIGLHRYRYSNNNNLNWNSISISNFVKIKKILINYSISKLFTQTWDKNTMLLSAKINIIRNYFVQIGVITYFLTNLNYSPFITLSTII